MENIPEAMTTKEGKEMELKYAKLYKLNANEDIFELRKLKVE